ncbi:hypothetical protein MMC16_007788 [Acarospora aff. strigata]|nr:hypothetical protein [Acarospora aff. strigata]
MQDELQQKQQQFNEESVSSSTQSQTAAEPLQADPKTDSSSHTPEIQSSVPGATETASQLQQEQSSTAAHSTSEHLTNAPGSPDPEEPGAMSAEDLRASQHTQAMEPGIEALRKRRAALQQHSSPGDGESLSEQHAHQMSEHRAAEEQDDAAAASTAEPGLLDETLPAAAQTAVNLHAPRSTPAAPLQGQQTRTSQNQPLDAGSQTAQTLRTEIPGSSQAAGIGGHHADDISGVFSSAEERQLTGAEPSNTQDDYDSLLDAIAAGNFDWEPPGQQSPSIQASEQQPSINQPRQPSLQSQQAAADQTNSQQQAWPEQVEAMPSVPADMPLEEHAAGGAGPDEQAVTSSHPTDMPASGHHQTTRQSSQQPAEAQPSQDPVSSEQGRQSAEAAEQAWPWDSSKAADTPTLAADVVARSNSRLRLRRASPSLQPQKQAGRTQPAGKPEPAGRSRTLSDLLKSKRRSGQGTMQETEWRVTDSQQMTAKEFVKPPVDIDSQRPVWAASAASAAGVGADAEAAKHEDGNQQSGPPSESRPLTKQELRALAARRGLDYQRLLADALSRGIPVSD